MRTVTEKSTGKILPSFGRIGISSSEGRSNACIQVTGYIFLLFLASTAFAQPPPEIILRGKKATAFVTAKSAKRTATAFCVAESGFFLTGAQMVQDLPPGEKLTLVLTPGVKNQRVTQAAVVRVDRDADLALLKIEPNGSLTALKFDDSDALIETMPVTTFGYPSGNPNEVPAVMVSAARVTALHKTKGVLHRIQLDASLNPGHSGGPILDNRGRVVGVVGSFLAGSGVNVAIPSSTVTQFLRRPAILFEPPTIPFAKRSTLREFRVRLIPLMVPLQAPTVTLTLTEPGEAPRHIPMSSVGKHVFIARAVPILPRTAPRYVNITIPGASPPVVTQVKNRDFVVGKETLKLSQVGSIESRDGKTTVTLTNGRQIVGSVTGLNAVEGSLGNIPTTLDLSQAPSVFVAESDSSSDLVSYQITVKQGYTRLAESFGPLLLADKPGTPRRGMVLVCADEWPTVFAGTTNPALNREADAVRYILNIANLFTGGRRGRFLIYSDHLAFGEPFRGVLRRVGHTVVHYSQRTPPLDEFDAIFAGGSPNLDRSVLAPYVQRGGKVYLAGGCVNEGWTWRDFLRPFGMSFGADVLPDTAITPELGKHPLFQGVKQLFIGGFSPIRLLPGSPPQTKILTTYNNMNIWALYVSDPILPPGTIPLQGTNYVQNPANGHWYCAVRLGKPMLWTEVRAMAEKMTYRGKKGHLVTLTSAEEDAFVVRNFPGDAQCSFWVGGFKQDGRWQWVTGEPMGFSNWGSGEPNDTSATVNYMNMFPAGGWNDTANEDAHGYGFIVEFE